MKNIVTVFLSLLLTITPTMYANAQVAPVAQQSQDTNYVGNGGFENAKSGWKAYKDTASPTPTSGAGAGPTTTLTTTTSAPIQGKSSGLLTKPASNSQGEGISYSFALDSAAKGRVLTISGAYQIISGTYSGGSSTTDSDVEVYIYDVDAGQVIQPTGYKLDGGVSGFNYTVNATFQSNISSTNYRLIFHEATTSASAYTLKFDQIKIGTGSKTQAVPATDWATYTPTVTYDVGPATNVTWTGYWRRVGDSAEIKFKAVFTGAAGTFQYPHISYPAGLTLDTTKQPVGANGYTVLGQASFQHSGVSNFEGEITYNNSTSVTISTITSNANGQLVPGAVTSTAPFSWTTNDTMVGSFRIPIQGWSSNTTMSDSADTRVVAMSVQSGNVSSANPITGFSSPTVDTHGGLSGSIYTIKVPGIYKISAQFQWTVSASAGNYANLSLYKNSSPIITQTKRATGTATGTDSFPFSPVFISCNSGDTLYFAISSTNYSNISAAPDGSFWSIERASGPAQIAASESVNASYYNSAGVGFAATGTFYQLTFDTKVKDSHGMMSNGTVTVPTSGTYQACATMAAYASSAGPSVDLSLNMASGAVAFPIRWNMGAGIIQSGSVCGTASMTAGQSITVQGRCYFSSGTCGTNNALGGASAASLSVVRVGN